MAIPQPDTRARVLESVLERSPVPHCILDADHILYLNVAAAELLGGDREQIARLPSIDLVLPEQRPAFLERVAQVLHQQETLTGLRIDLLRLDNSVLRVRVNAWPVDIEGQVLVAAGFELLSGHRGAEDLARLSTAMRESAARESEEQFKLLANSIPQLAWIADAEGWIFWYNQRWHDYTGATPEEMEGWGWQTVHDPAVLPQVMDRWTRAIRDGRQFEMVFPLRRFDGVFRSFLTRVNPVRDRAGKIVRWVGSNTDIHELRAAREALAISEQRFRAAARAVSDFVWTNTADGEMRGPQPDWQEFTGQTAEDLQGFGWTRAVHPDDVQPTLQEWSRCIAGRSDFKFEHRVRRRDGRYRFCSVHAVPLLSDDGSIREWVGVHTDVTDERNQERELLRQREMIDVAQSAANAGIFRWEVTSDTAYLSAESYRLFDLSPRTSASAADVMENVFPEDRDQINSALKLALSTGEYHAEFRVKRSDGDVRWVEGRGRLLRDPLIGPYIVGLNLDITAKKRAEQALIKSEKLAALGRLASTIAHEINNPLEAVTNLLYLAETNPAPDQSRVHLLQAQQELRRVTDIVTQTLRFHRQSTRPRLTSIPELLDSVFKLHQSKLTQARVRVQTRYAGAEPVLVMEGEMRQVLANLVGNAIDAMPRGGRLLARVHRSHDARGNPGICVVIADTGSGISADAMHRVFEPFFTTKGASGTGLGLWVSAEIVQKHGGAMRVRSSTAPGAGGTVFRLFLPCASPFGRS